MKPLYRHFAGALLAVFLLAACSQSDDPTESAPDDGAGVSLTTSVTPSEDSPETEAEALEGESTDDAMAEAAQADQEALDEAPGDDEELFPDVIDAVATQDGDGTWTFSVTLSSPYDSPERYADAWRVVGADGTEYGIRELTHDHADEQPFNRSQSGIEIPDDVETVIVEGRDQVSGWGGAIREVQLAR